MKSARFRRQIIGFLSPKQSMNFRFRNSINSNAICRFSLGIQTGWRFAYVTELDVSRSRLERQRNFTKVQLKCCCRFVGGNAQFREKGTQKSTRLTFARPGPLPGRVIHSRNEQTSVGMSPARVPALSRPVLSPGPEDQPLPRTQHSTHVASPFETRLINLSPLADSFIRPFTPRRPGLSTRWNSSGARIQ